MDWIKSRFLFITLLALVIPWAVVSIYNANYGNAQEFQRAGALGVAGGVVGIGLLAYEIDKLKSLLPHQTGNDLKYRFLRASRAIFRFETFFVGMTTLQWGYGDVFFCWLTGKGWTSC